MGQFMLKKSIKTRKLEKSTMRPVDTHEYPVPFGAIVDDLYEEKGMITFLWKGEPYQCAAGTLGKAYTPMD